MRDTREWEIQRLRVYNVRCMKGRAPFEPSRCRTMNGNRVLFDPFSTFRESSGDYRLPRAGLSFVSMDRYHRHRVER